MKEYAFYPGCSSQRGDSADNFLRSLDVVCKKLELKLNELPDWNCCGASIAYGEGGELPRLALGARNLALTEEKLPGQDMVSVCPACWLANRETAERLHQQPQMHSDVNTALAEAGLKYTGAAKPRHFIEVLVEDVGWEGMKKPVLKPLAGLKIAGYVGCQTNRPFGMMGESFENPVYLDNMIALVGAEPVPYDQKVSCCGGALAFSEPDKAQERIRAIVESACDHGADMIVTPCQLCQANVEVYQSEINKKQGTSFNIPVVYYTQLMSVAYGGSAKEAGLDGQLIKAGKLEAIAAK